MPVRIFDCVIVSSGRDLALLEARMTELADLPVIHVIAESVTDHHGSPKPLHFAESTLWPQWHGRWNHVRVETGELEGDTPKARKDSLREFLAHGVSAGPDDIILHGGIDEIPAPAAVRALLEGEARPPVALQMRWCAYRPGKVHPEPWNGTVAQRWGRAGSFCEMRDSRNALPLIVSAGTRLSMFGEEEQDIHPDGRELREEEVNDTWPRWTQNRI